MGGKQKKNNLALKSFDIRLEFELNSENNQKIDRGC